MHNIEALKKKAHTLKPVILIGNKGLTPEVHREIDFALTAHELIKINVRGAEKEDIIAMIDAMVAQHSAVFVQLIGKTIVLWRRKAD